MDVPEPAEASRGENEGAAEAGENSGGSASAFRRALDAQASVPGQALVPVGPHDLTVSIERARILKALAEPRHESRPAQAEDARNRVPPWSPSIRWVGGAAVGVTSSAAEQAPANARGPEAAASNMPAGVAGDIARPPHRAPARRPKLPTPSAVSPSGPTPPGDGLRTSKRRRAILIAVVLAAVVSIVFVLLGSGDKAKPAPVALPSELSSSAPGLTGGKGTMSPTAAVSDSTASSKPSSSASPHESADAAATTTTTRAAASGSASPSAQNAGAVTTASSASTTTAAATALSNASSGECLSTPGSAYSAGAVERVATCSGGAFQAWTLTSSGQLTQDGGAYCLDDYNWESSPGSEVDLWPCNGGSNQQWSVDSDGSIVGAYSRLCVALSGRGTAVELERCDGEARQRWSWR
jgi:hypothetical protein